MSHFSLKAIASFIAEIVSHYFADFQISRRDCMIAVTFAEIAFQRREDTVRFHDKCVANIVICRHDLRHC